MLFFNEKVEKNATLYFQINESRWFKILRRPKYINHLQENKKKTSINVNRNKLHKNHQEKNKKN